MNDLSLNTESQDFTLVCTTGFSMWPFLKPGEKLDVAHLSLWENTWTTSFYRTMVSMLVKGESRNTAFEFIQETIDRAFQLAEFYLMKKDEDSNDKGRTILHSIQQSLRTTMEL